MKIKSLILMLAVAALNSANATETLPQIVNVIGQVYAPQLVVVEGPTTLAQLVEKCGGVNRLWGRVVIITKKESNMLTITRKYEFHKIASKEEQDAEFRKIVIEAGEIVDFRELFC
jgi:hypothetical protein